MTRTPHNLHVPPRTLIVSVLILSLSVIPISAVRGQSASENAELLLRKSIKATFSGTRSVTAQIHRSNRMILDEENMTVQQTSHSTLRYDPPFVSVEMNTEMSLDRGGGSQKLKKQTTRLLHHLNRQNRCFVKTGDNVWENCQDASVTGQLRQQFIPFYRPQKYISFFKKTTVTGTESLDNNSFVRISGPLQLENVRDYAEAHLSTMLGGRTGHRNVTLKVTSAELSFLVSEEPPRVRRMKLVMEQNMTVGAGPAGERELSIQRTQKQTVDYVKHGETFINENERTPGNQKEEKKKKPAPSEATGDSTG